MKVLFKTFLIILLCSGVAYGAADVRTQINSLNASNTLEVSYIAYFSGGYNQYLQTEDTFKRTVLDAASLMNSNAGNQYFGSFYSRVNDWNPALAGGETVKFYISRPVNGTCGSATGTYNAGSTTTLGPIGLATTNYLAEPSAFNVIPGDTSALIMWGAVSGADSYYVYRRYYNSGSDWGPKTSVPNNYALYQYVGNTTSNYYHDSSLTNGDKYFYIIFAQQGSMTKVSAHTDEIMVTPDATNAPTIALLNPNNGVVGDPIVITGTKLGSSQGSGNVYFNGAPALPGDIQNWNGSITVKVPSGATTGNVYVVNSSGEASNGVAFTVIVPGVPDITSCSPARYAGDSSVIMSVVGTSTNFVNNTTAATVNPATGVTVNSVTVSDTTHATIEVSIAAGTAAGSRDITLKTGTEYATGEGLFVISPSSISGVSNGAQGTVVPSVTVSGTGTHFQNGVTTVAFSGTGVTGEVTGASQTSATIKVYIQPTAAMTARSVTMATNLGALGTESITGGTFTVTSGLPTVTGVSPNSGTNDKPTSITITGTNFTGTTVISIGAVSVQSFTPPNSGGTQISAVIQSGLTVGPYDIRITNPVGTSAIVVADHFTVSAPGHDHHIYESSGGIMMAYPNPFDPLDRAHPLNMLFGAATGEAIDIYIFDTNGRVIYQDKTVAVGPNVIVPWDGKTSYGEVVENGLYLIRVVKGNSLVAKGKILVIKK